MTEAFGRLPGGRILQYHNVTPASYFAPYDPALFRLASVARQELAMPPTITLEQAAGFGLFMLRAVLNGRGDEVIDLARSNLWR